MESIFTRAPRRSTLGNSQDRAFRMACRTVGPGGGLRAGDRWSRAPANQWCLRIIAGRLLALRDVTVGVIERPSIEEPRLPIGGAWGHLRGEIDAAQSLVRIQSAPRALESPRVLLSDPPGAVDRRSTGDEPRTSSPELRIIASADFDATSLLICDPLGATVDSRSLLRQEDPRPLGEQDPHATCHRARYTRRECHMELLQHAQRSKASAMPR